MEKKAINKDEEMFFDLSTTRSVDRKKYIDEILQIMGKNGWKKARHLFTRILNDKEVLAYINSANLFARYIGYTDHGFSHGIVVAHNAIVLYDLVKDMIKPSIVSSGYGDEDDAALIIVTAAFMHDMGNSIHREKHFAHSTWIAKDLITKYLEEMYDEPQKKIDVLTHILHAIFAHDESVQSMTIESGLVKVADGTDISAGRSKMPIRQGKIDMHSISVYSIEKVTFDKEPGKGVNINVYLKDPAGVFQIEEILMKKLMTSGMMKYFQVRSFLNDKMLQIHSFD